MKMKELKVKLTFTEEILGTASGNPEIHADFIASNAPDAPSRQEEIEAIGVDEEIEKTKTVFPRDDEGNPMFWDYQFKGFFKDACGMLRNVDKTESKKLKAYKKKIDGLVFVEPRKIPIVFDGEIGNCQRPLRAQTLQGERIALANSETIPAGASCEINVVCLQDDLEDAVIEWLDYGKRRGMAQWRNSGKGTFTYELL